MRKLCTTTKTVLVFLFFLLLFVHTTLVMAADSKPTVILIRPQQTQIENLLVLKQQELLSQNIQVIALYHEDELTDYQASRDYVTQQNLHWVRFETIKGGITLQGERPGRGINEWTEQFSRLMNDSDGIIFTGGMDLPPRLYGEEMRLTTESTTPIRSMYEFSFLHHLVGDKASSPDEPISDKSAIPFLKNRPDYTVLCICLGCQTLNAAAGGSLIQNIPAQIYGLNSYEDVLRLPPDQIHSGRYLTGLNAHIADSLPPALHRIRANGLGRITPSLLKGQNKNPLVLSSHHQSIALLGNGLLVTAMSMDGRVVEMIEHEQYPAVLGVQYHPEAMSLYRTDLRFRHSDWTQQTKKESAAKAVNKLAWMNYGSISDDPSYSLREQLEKSDSMTVHRTIWNWFSSALNHSHKKR